MYGSTNGIILSSSELSYLTTELANTSKKTIIFTHASLASTQNTFLNTYFNSNPDKYLVSKSIIYDGTKFYAFLTVASNI